MTKQKQQNIPIIHPGEILLEEFLNPMAISQYRLAKNTNMPNTRVSDIVHGRRAITADTALRFARFFGNSPQFWMNLQTTYDLRIAEKSLQNKLDREVQPIIAA